MGDTSLRISEEAKARLDLHKRDDESYDDVILRLTSTEKWAGFGALADEEQRTRDGMEEIREHMREGMAEDLESEKSNRRE